MTKKPLRASQDYSQQVVETEKMITTPFASHQKHPQNKAGVDPFACPFTREVEPKRPKKPSQRSLRSLKEGEELSDQDCFLVEGWRLKELKWIMRRSSCSAATMVATKLGDLQKDGLREECPMNDRSKWVGTPHSVDTPDCGKECCVQHQQGEKDPNDTLVIGAWHQTRDRMQEKVVSTKMVRSKSASTEYYEWDPYANLHMGFYDRQLMCAVHISTIGLLYWMNQGFQDQGYEGSVRNLPIDQLGRWCQEIREGSTALWRQKVCEEPKYGCEGQGMPEIDSPKCSQENQEVMQRVRKEPERPHC